MHLESGGIYHIYNQGNNRQHIFYSRENYLFFIRKIRHHILPFADVLAWCLMPNHFHLMVEVRETRLDKEGWDTLSLEESVRGAISQGATSRGDTSRGESSRGATSSRTPTNNNPSIDLNHSLGILLSSYTRAINTQENTTGSLFRQKTKAICLNEIKGISSDWYTSFGVTFMKTDMPEFRYIQVCFNYIHQNPVNARLVIKAEDWEFSSYIDLIGKRSGNLVNREKVEKLGLMTYLPRL